MENNICGQSLQFEYMRAFTSDSNNLSAFMEFVFCHRAPKTILTQYDCKLAVETFKFNFIIKF